MVLEIVGYHERAVVLDAALVGTPPEERLALIAGELSAEYEAGKAAERERCALEADKIAEDPPTEPAGRHHDWQMGWQDGAMNAASAIRSLPTTSGGEG